MSESTGGGDGGGASAPGASEPCAPAGALSFPQGKSATTGLTAYDLERGTKKLFWSPGRRRRTGRIALKKDYHMRATLDAMVDTLSRSVADAVAAGQPIDDVLAKNLPEFADHLEATIAAAREEDLAKMAPPEPGETVIVPLHKSLGSIGELHALVEAMHHHSEALKARDGDDRISDTAAGLLDHAVGVGTLALRHEVNRHCEPMLDDEDGDMPDGVHMVLVPTAEDPDDRDSDIALKTVLPGDLAKMAEDPALLAQDIVEHAASLMLLAGVPQANLEKMFAPVGEPLRKQFPPKKKAEGGGDSGGAAPAAAGQGGAQGGDGTPQGVDPNAVGDDGSDPNGDDGQDTPLSVLGRLLAACMIQLDQCQQVYEGGADDGSGDPNADPGADPSGAPGDGSPAPGDPIQGTGPQPGDAGTGKPMKKADGGGEMGDRMAGGDLNKALREEIDALKAQVTRLGAQPEPGKGYVGPAPGAVALAKGAGPGDEDPDAELRKIASEIDRLPTEKLRQEATAQYLVKRALRSPIAH